MVSNTDPFAEVRATVDFEPQERNTLSLENDPFAEVRATSIVSKESESFSDLLYSEEPTAFEKGLNDVFSAIGRGVGKAATNIIRRDIDSTNTESLPALLGMNPSTATEEAIVDYIQESIPQEPDDTKGIPSTIESGVELAVDPASWIGGGPIGAFTVGAVEKGLENAGAPKWLQLAGGVAASLLRPGSNKTKFTDKSPEIKNAQKLMKERGLNDKEITLATNAIKERSALEKVARKYASTEEQIASTKSGIEKGTRNIISEQIQGFEKGIEEVQKRASKLFDPVKKEASALKIRNSDPFQKASNNIIKEVENTLANTPDEKAFIEMLKTAQEEALNGKYADSYINFYQTLNRIGRWLDPSRKENLMRMAKESVKDTFRVNGAEGKRLANIFEKANNGWVKYNDAEAFSKVFDKALVDEVIDFNKLNRIFSSNKNINIGKKALGEKAFNSFKEISEIGKQVERFNKSLDPGFFSKGLMASEAFGAVQALLSLDPKQIASSGLLLGTIEGGKYLATQLLTNPKYQNLYKKLANNYMRTPQAAIPIMKDLEEMAKKEFLEDQKSNLNSQ